MKKKRLKIILTVMVVGILLAGRVFAGTIVGSEHDFSTETTWNTTGEICIVCHTPHNANSSNDGPLWNHDSTAVSAYTLYTNSDTLDAAIGQPSGVSKACLSCHDGTVALNSFGGNEYTGADVKFSPTDERNLGADLSNDHPISFTYDSGLADTDGELVTPQSASTVDGTVPLFTAKVECASCHDVHNTPGIEKLLVKTNAASALCLTCHSK